MTTVAQHPLLLPMPDGSALGLHVSRFDERQRRLRLRLSKTATCWDYAPLIDVVRREPGFDAHRFTGKTASEWLADLQRRRSPDEMRFKRWYEAVVQRFLQTLARRPRVPDNHYCIELAVPPLVSTLPNAILGLGLKRASVEQWLATLPVLWTKGMQTIRAIPLYGLSVANQWFQTQVEPTKPSDSAVTAGPKGVLNA